MNEVNRSSGPSGLGGGRHAISLLARPFSKQLLFAIEDRPSSINEIAETLETPSKSAVVRYVRHFVEMGALEPIPAEPGSRLRKLHLTDYGRGLVTLTMLVDGWFEQWPGDGSISIESELGQRTIESRAKGWGPQILWVLEQRPRHASALEAQVGAIREAKQWELDTGKRIRQRVLWMQETRQIEPVAPGAHPTLYRPSEWSRQGTGVLAYAISLEDHYRPPHVKPPSARVIAFGMVQIGHLVRLEDDVSCEFAAAVRVPGWSDPVVVTYVFERGRLATWRWRADYRARAGLDGDLKDWLGSLTGMEQGDLVPHGDRALAQLVLMAIRNALFAPPV